MHYTGAICLDSPASISANEGAESTFVQQFQQAVRSCLRRGFTVEECFALIWTETLEEIDLPESEHRRVGEHLRQWAYSCRSR